VTNNLKNTTNEKAQHGPNIFFGFAPSEDEGGILHFPLVPNVFLSKFSMSSNDVNIMFSSSCHNVPNDLS
jgi:hypothetical protein